MKKSNLHKNIKKMKLDIFYARHSKFILTTLLLVSVLSFQAYRELKHRDEIKSLVNHEAMVKDSMAVYIEEMAAALDLFTDGDPLIFTAYNAMVSQTDDTPNITASNKEIFPGVLALSRELITRYGHGGDIQYGDKVWMVVPMQVEDTMNKRWRARGDVYMMDYDEARRFGRREGILYKDDKDAEFASAIEDDAAEVSVLN
jgi:3D (Asp-Asp-Asp) domain-containing protein